MGFGSFPGSCKTRGGKALMDQRQRPVMWVVAMAVVSLQLVGCAYGNVFSFRVTRKYSGPTHNLTALRAHDVRRHGRLLAATAAADVPLGGIGNPTEAGLYYATLGIGNPSHQFYVQVDTGSDILWVNCAGCNNCPTKSDLGLLEPPELCEPPLIDDTRWMNNIIIKLSFYDPESSSTANLVYCDQDFCTATYDDQFSTCKQGTQCQYKVVYGDGSATAGYFVKDAVQLDQVTGNSQTTPMKGNVVFGCGFQENSPLSSSTDALDGIIGFGQANSSMISQLAATGKVKKVFSHCLDIDNGGGIFAIGEVASPKVNTTPMVPHQAHYNVVLKGIKVGETNLEYESSIFDTGNRKAIIDSGTTLAYLPPSIYKPLIDQILRNHPELKLHSVENFTCFKFDNNIDDEFPIVDFIFDDTLNLIIFPHEYLFQIRDNTFCLGWLRSEESNGREMLLLGDLALSNKLVVYDSVSQTIGWTPYNCSSSIKVKDDSSGKTYDVSAHNISAASKRSLSYCEMLIRIFIFTLIHLLRSSTS